MNQCLGKGDKKNMDTKLTTIAYNVFVRYQVNNLSLQNKFIDFS
jgi:hypothetical protein